MQRNQKKYIRTEANKIKEQLRRNSAQVSSIQIKSSLKQKGEGSNKLLLEPSRFSLTVLKSRESRSSSYKLTHKESSKELQLNHLAVTKMLAKEFRRISNSTSSSKFLKQSSDGKPTTSLPNRERKLSAISAASS